MKHSNAGFTLMELIITLTVIVLLVALAVPSFQSSLDRNRLIAKTNDIVTALNLARSEAVTSGIMAGVCPSLDGVICAPGNWDQGWIVWVDTNGSGAFEVGEEVRVNNTPTSTNVNERVTAAASANITNGVTFTPLGITTNGALATITIDRPHGEQQRQITLSAFGQITTTCLNLNGADVCER